METPIFTLIEDIPQIVDNLRTYFNTNITKSLKWRITQLKGLINFLNEHFDEWIIALNKDLGSHYFESGLQIKNVISEIQHTIDNLDKWIYPKSLSNPWALYPGDTKLIYEPYGVVCDFIPFNYPMYLGFSTLLPIFASGNVCLFKPSSNTPSCSLLYQKYFPLYLDKNAIQVVCGPSSICDHILNCKFDFIFYTGSPSIGKNVMKAASNFLTPVLLELGGKSPVYVDKNISIDIVCKRLIWGKFFNAGQTCVCPDYILIHENIFEEFKIKIIKTINEFYGDISKYNDNLSHIISLRHYNRLINLIENCGGNFLLNGLKDKEKLYFGPTVIENPNLNSILMNEEIFGPILPLIPVTNHIEAINFINSKEKPLALYILSNSNEILNQFIKETSSGAIMFNDVVFHVTSPYAPFGGVGNSGLGKYHGKFGIKSLSHIKPIIKHSTIFDVSIKYPPYTENHYSILKHLA